MTTFVKTKVQHKLKINTPVAKPIIETVLERATMYITDNPGLKLSSLIVSRASFANLLAAYGAGKYDKQFTVYHADGSHTTVFPSQYLQSGTAQLNFR